MVHVSLALSMTVWLGMNCALPTRFQSDDDYSKYDVQPQDDGTYRIQVKADGSYWQS